MAQTTVQNSSTIRFGSAKFEMGATVGTMVNVGAIRNGVFEYAFDKVTVKADNAGTIKEAIANEKASLAGDLLEINFENLASFYAGVLTHTTTAAAPIAITDEIHVLTGTTEAKLTYKNGAGTEVASIVVTNAAGTMTMVRDCDYTVTVNADGSTSIARAYPTVIEGPTVVCATTGTTNYFLSAGSWNVQPAVGDHIYVSGFTDPANNGAKTVTAVTTTLITVSEVLVNEAEGDTVTITRGGIATGDTTLTDYSYTPLASHNLKGGGLTTFTARYARFTNTDSAGRTLMIDILSATPESGITIAFQPDDGSDVAVCPVKLVGTCNTALTAGQQLFIVTDAQHV